MTTTAESASVRDIPRCCTCEWDYRRKPARWVLTRPDPACIWHQRGGSTPEAAAPHLAAAGRERIRQPLCAPGGHPPNLICMECLRPVCRHCGGCECPVIPALCKPAAGPIVEGP